MREPIRDEAGRMGGAGRRAWPLLVAFLSLALAGGCMASGGGSPGDGDLEDLEELDRAEEEGDGRSVTVRVKNYHWAAVHVYIRGQGSSQRSSLGVVSTNNTSTFEVSQSKLGIRKQVILIADPVGSVRAFSSQPVIFEYGDLIDWTLHNPLSQSVLFVR